MSDLVQFVAGRSGELGVQGQYLDGELHLVDDALTGRLHFYPQLQVIRGVIQAVAIFVVNVFAFAKIATEFVDHYFAMLVDFFAAAQVESSVSGRMHMAFFRNRPPSATFPPTLFATEFLAFVVARMLAIFCLHKTAFFDFAARRQLALKSRSGFLVHEEQLLDSYTVVKGVG